MTPERFFAGDPRQLRVALRTTDDVQRGKGLPEIRIDIDAPSTKPLCYEFALEPVDPRSSGEPPLDALPAHRQWFAFALSRGGNQAFERARREVRVKGLEEVNMSVQVTMNDVLQWPEAATSVKVGIDVSLATKDGYFTFIKESDVARTSSKTADQNPSASYTKPKPSCVPAS